MSSLFIKSSLRISLLGLCLAAVLCAQPATAFADEEEVIVTVKQGRYARSPDPGCIGEKTRDSSARCKQLCVFLRAHAKIDRVRIYVKEANAPRWTETRANAEPIGWAKFVGNYTVERVSNEKRIRWLFKNWSHDRARQARMVVYYQ